jgi:hypothetical protein
MGAGSVAGLATQSIDAPPADKYDPEQITHYMV